MPLGDRSIRNIGASIVWVAAFALIIQRPKDSPSLSFGNVSCCFCAVGLLCTQARHFRGEQQLLDHILAYYGFDVKPTGCSCLNETLNPQSMHSPLYSAMTVLLFTQ